jgi:hypothetical protein
LRLKFEKFHDKNEDFSASNFTNRCDIDRHDLNTPGNHHGC